MQCTRTLAQCPSRRELSWNHEKTPRNHCNPQDIERSLPISVGVATAAAWQRFLHHQFVLEEGQPKTFNRFDQHPAYMYADRVFFFFSNGQDRTFNLPSSTGHAAARQPPPRPRFPFGRRPPDTARWTRRSLNSLATPKLLATCLWIAFPSVTKAPLLGRTKTHGSGGAPRRSGTAPVSGMRSELTR